MSTSGKKGGKSVEFEAATGKAEDETEDSTKTPMSLLDLKVPGPAFLNSLQVSRCRSQSGKLLEEE